MIEMGWTRADVMNTPRKQLQVEWEAARFNRSVREHDEAIGTIDARLKELSRGKPSKDRSAAMDELKIARRKMMGSFTEHMERFWYGNRHVNRKR